MYTIVMVITGISYNTNANLTCLRPLGVLPARQAQLFDSLPE